MKFQFPFRFSKAGITKVTKDDRLIYSWVSLLTLGFSFYSSKYELDFSTESMYLKYKADLEGGMPREYSKLLSFEYTDILAQWIYMKFPYEHVIVLSEINVMEKNIQFWAKIPNTEAVHFLKDIVVLRCKDKTEVERLVNNIAPEFAIAYGYSAGQYVLHNGGD